MISNIEVDINVDNIMETKQLDVTFTNKNSNNGVHILPYHLYYYENNGTYELIDYVWGDGVVISVGKDKVHYYQTKWAFFMENEEIIKGKYKIEFFLTSNGKKIEAYFEIK
jgi:hypothetical protein